MNIGLFGGTFDPIHRGHLALARAARERCKLSRILFVPANVPPHKQRQPSIRFAHRYAMIALATAQEKDFIAFAARISGRASNQKAPGKERKRRDQSRTTRSTRSERLKQSFKRADRLVLADWH